MNFRKMGGKLVRFSLGSAAVLLGATACFGQGCALCYSDAAATSPQAQAALRHGILILLIPPIILFSAVCSILYRRCYVYRESRPDDFAPTPLATTHGSSGIALPLN